MQWPFPAILNLRSDRFEPKSPIMIGSLTLRDHPADMARGAGDKCGRARPYRKQNLIERFGPEIALPDLRDEIA